MVKSEASDKVLLYMLKHPTQQFNPLEISREVDITHSGAFRLFAKLENEGFVHLEKRGRYNYYGLKYKSKVVRKYLSYLIQKEKDAEKAKIKMWVNRISEIKSAKIAILFGSVLHKSKPNDIDIVFVTPKNATNLYKEVDKINIIALTKIHPIVQTKQDLINNIRKKDPVIMKSLGGILVFGDEEYFDVLAEVCYVRD